jgi:pyrroloquinoline quinone (PQQ) biosynthesis protein C
MRSTAEISRAQSERLRGKIELLLPALLDAGRTLLTDARIRELYPEYLVTSHWIVRASVPLMEAALERATTMLGEDPVSAGLARYLEQHIPEELHHDEWLLEDLEAAGTRRADVLARPPSATIAALVGAQYYWIFHYHPVALLGYIALLEGYPPTASEIEGLVASTGYPPDAFRTLRKHGELDPHHAQELDETLDALPLTREQSTVMGLSALHTVATLTRAIDEIRAK